MLKLMQVFVERARRPVVAQLEPSLGGAPALAVSLDTKMQVTSPNETRQPVSTFPC